VNFNPESHEKTKNLFLIISISSMIPERIYFGPECQLNRKLSLCFSLSNAI